MRVSTFLRRTAAAAVLTALGAAAGAQPLPHTSLNQTSSGHAFTLGTAPAKHPAAVGGGCAPDGLCLAVTLALADAGQPDLCGTDTSLAVSLGDQVNVCYTVTNHSATTLSYQSLSDDHAGQLLSNQNVAIAPGASYQYNRVITASTNPGNDSGTFVSTWTATDILPGYSADASAAYAFVDISGSGTALTLADDGASPVTMPFAFPFFGGSSSALCIGNNGELRFDAANCSSSPYNNAALPASSLDGPAILPYWDDMLANGTIYYATLGTSPNRQFVVEYKDKFVYGDSGDPTGQTGATWEVVLNESDGTIDFEYQTAGFGGAGAAYDDGASATVGLQSNAAFANQYSYDTASLGDGLAIAWTPADPVTYTATAAAVLDIGAPSVVTTPDASAGFTPEVAAGGATSAQLLIDNIGNRDLQWSLVPPAADAHFPKTPRTAAPARAPWDLAGASPGYLRRPGKKRPAIALGAGTVPVYTTAPTAGGADYVSFDALNPGTFNTIRTNSPALFGITFADSDFSKEYGVDYFEGDLYSISTLDGSASVIGNTGLISCCMIYAGGMRWDATTGTTYLVIDNWYDHTSALYTIDLATAGTTLIGPLAGVIRDIAIDSSGLMYGIDSDADTLVAIDKTNGATQTIGSLGIDAVFGQGLDFDATTGLLYLASTDGSAAATMYRVDPVTGATSEIGSMEREVDAMAIAKPAGMCSTPADTPWMSYDPTSGTVAPDPDLAHPATVDVSFDATGLPPGAYTANLCVYSNDPSHSRLTIPVALTVTSGGAADEIFADGFDGSGSGGGTTAISQTSDSTPVAQNSAACGDSSAGTTADNQYWRRYVFGEYPVPSPANVASVDVAVEQTSGAPNVTVTLYTMPHGVAADTIDLSQLTQIGVATLPAPADASLTTFNVPVTGTVADTSASDLVVEVSTEDEGLAFYIGSTPAPETHPSFLSSAACGISDPVPTSTIGFPDMHVIEAINVES